MILVYAFTTDIQISFSVGILEFFSKLLLYYAHERVWDRVKWGIPA